MPPKVSVIIPTHNRAEMVQRAIQSVLAQTWQGTMEIIVVSDGSTDNTENVVNSFNDPRIRFFKHETSGGASAARNTGLRASRGEFIAFLDDDDEWTPDKLEVQMPVIERSPAATGLVYCWIEYVQNGNRSFVICPTLMGDIFVEMLDNQAITNSSALIIKRAVLDLVPGFDESLPRGNDGDFIRRISKHYHVEYVPQILVSIHIGHGDRISINSRRNLLAAIFAYEKRLRIFENAFAKYPDRKTSVLCQIATTCLQTGHLIKGAAYIGKMFSTPSSLSYKAGRVWWLIKNQIRFHLDRIFPRKDR